MSGKKKEKKGRTVTVEGRHGGEKGEMVERGKGEIGRGDRCDSFNDR